MRTGNGSSYMCLEIKNAAKIDVTQIVRMYLFVVIFPLAKSSVGYYNE